MQNVVIGRILAILFLIILCFVLGAMGAESAKSAAVLMMAGAGSLVMLLLGKRCWVLIFLLFPLAAFIPHSKISKFSIAMLVGNAVFLYWILLWMMGYVKIRWRSMFVMDLLLLCMFIYMVATYVRYPVALQLFGGNMDRIGAGAYLVFISASLYYIAISCIPMKTDSLIRVLEWAAILTLLAYFLGSILQVAGINTMDAANLNEASVDQMLKKRFVAFLNIGMYGALYIYAKYSLKHILCSPLLSTAVLLSIAGVVIAAFRGFFVCLMAMLGSAALVKREITQALSIILFGICGIYVLNSADMVKELPWGAQRILAYLPGVTVNSYALHTAKGTIDWRYELWDLALDSRTGYIKDYVWGDGLGYSKSQRARLVLAAARNPELWYGKHIENTADSKSWHNGFITSIQTVGCVGLSLMLLIYAYTFIMMFRVAGGTREKRMMFLTIFYMCPMWNALEELLSGATGEILFFIYDFVHFSFMKLLYCTARDEGWLQNIFQKKSYVPRMIHEHGDIIQGRQIAS